MIARSNASPFSLASLLRVSAGLFNNFLKVFLSFGDPEAAGLSPLLIIARTIIKTVIERALSIDAIVIIPWSQDNVQIRSAKELSSSRIFPKVCLLLATCVWISSWIFNSVLIVAYFLVFESSSLILYCSFYFRRSRIILKFF